MAPVRRRWQRWLFVGVLGFVVVLLLLLLPRSLPSDDEAIAHFRAHRDAIERLLRSYRTLEPTITDAEWERLPETTALMKEAGARRIIDSGAALWLPNSYADEAVNRVDSLVRSKGVNPAQLKRKFGGVAVRLSDERYGLRLVFFRPALVAVLWKEFYFIPEIPRIEGERLLYPTRVNGKLEVSDRVFASLDSYPGDWRKGECVLRQMEPHWFLRMCWAAA